MPKYGEDVALEQHNVGNFGFTAVSLDDLESSGYTLATIVCDRSGSTSGYQDTMEAALKSSIEALLKHPSSESIMVRVLTVDSVCEEQHGFIPLPDINTDRYDGVLAARGMTALFDGCVNAAEAASTYGRQLLHDRFNANGILIVITDGMNNAGQFSADSDVIHVQKAFEDTKLTECLESFTTVLIAVNMEHAQVASGLRQFHTQAGFSTDLIDLKDASPETIAKIGEFITESVEQHEHGTWHWWTLSEYQILMNVDHHYMIGASHTQCEDYAASLDGFAALADGCSVVLDSDGHPMTAHTDIGARLMVRAASDHRDELDVDIRHKLIIHTANGYRRQLDLPVESLSATLLMVQYRGEHIDATCCGDGMIAARRRDGRWFARQFVYPWCPYYLRYTLDRRVEFTSHPAELFQSSTGLQTSYPESHVRHLHFATCDFDLVIAMSDGSSSFTPADATWSFTERLLDFRRMKGRFVLRHLRGVVKELAADGIVNQDDISMIAVHED